MRLEFCTIKLRDFKEYRGLHVLDLSGLGYGLQYMRGENKVDAIGSNGAGKSSIWDAFLWALTGRTTRGMRGTDVRTWGNDQHAKVSVGFYNDAGWHWVKRSTEKNGLWLDGKLTSQEEIDRTIGLTATTIPHTILLGQKKELFFDLQPAAKLSILSETLNLDKWDERSKRAKAKTEELDARMIEQDAAIRETAALLQNMRTTLEGEKESSRAWEDERSQGSEQRLKRIAGLIKSREIAITEMGTHDLAYDGAETELRACRHDLKRLGEAADVARDKLMRARTVRATLKQRYNEFRDLAASDVCPTCGQAIANKKAHAQEAKQKLADALETVKAAAKKEEAREEKLEEIKAKIDRTRKAEQEFGRTSDDAKDKLDHLKAHVADIDQQIAVLKAKDRSNETNPFEATIRMRRKTIKDIRTDLAALKETSDALSRRHIRVKYWIDGFKQIRLYLLQEMLEELTEVTQNILPDVGLAGWIVEYDIERETKSGSIATGLNVRILKPGMSKPVKWEAWSGGENQRLLIVGAIALADVLLRHAGIECDMLVLDEPTRHMSREGVNDLVEHLIELGRDRQIFYVDHQVVESNRFAHVLTITKDGEGSHINVT
jgi:DNA repair exonuclease SbcCD ATPase subunit